jgi:hypothetical protein
MPVMYVLVFDMCSSTLFIDDLHQNSRVDNYTLLTASIDRFLCAAMKKYYFKKYKFLGDGYILLFDGDTRIDDVLFFALELTFSSQYIIDWFIDNFVERKDIPRRGITAGLDKGEVFLAGSDDSNQEEYIGRPINVACRLQSSLIEKEHANKLLMSFKLYKEIETYLLKKACVERERILRNIRENRPLRCYEFNPEFFREFDVSLIRKPTGKLRKIIEEEREEIKLFQRLNEEIKKARGNYTAN